MVTSQEIMEKHFNKGKMFGYRVDEVDSFLDQVSRMNLSQATIIHGKGTGVLRTAVQQHLRKCPQVKSFRLGVYGEGESGVTIVELK